MATIPYAGANLYPKQRAALFDEHRISICEASTKSGKTSGALAWLFEKAALEGKQGRNYWWVAPVFGQAEIAFRRMKLAVPRSLYKQNQSKLTITLVNGAVLWFKSAERPDDLYGEDVFAVVLDEASRMREEAWHAVRSTLTATKGPVRMIGNVKGRKNFFYQLARDAEAGTPDMAYHRITAWDAVEAGVLDREEIEASRRDFARLGREGAWRQLYLAEAADDGDNPFGLAAIRDCLVNDFSKERALVAGVDLAGRGAVNMNVTGENLDRDYTAIVMLDRDGYATHVERFRKSHTETEKTIVSTLGNTMALVDATGSGDQMVERLQKRGTMRVEGYSISSERARQDLMEGLALAIGEQSVHFPDGPMRAELESFEYDYRRTGVSYVVPSGMHDDLVFALALAVKKMPYRRKTKSVPTGVPAPGGSRWGDGADDAYQRYLATKPTQSGMQDEVEREDAPSISVPTVVSGPAGGRWGGAG